MSTADFVMHLICDTSFCVWLRKRLCVRDHLREDVKGTKPPPQKHVSLHRTEYLAKLGEQFPLKGHCPLTPDTEETQNTFKICSWETELITLLDLKCCGIDRDTGFMAHNSFPISVKLLVLHKYLLLLFF